MIKIKYLTDKFAILVINNPNKSVITCYNYFIDKVSNEEARFITDNYILFIKLGETIRNNTDKIKENYIKKEFNSFFLNREVSI